MGRPCGRGCGGGGPSGRRRTPAAKGGVRTGSGGGDGGRGDVDTDLARYVSWCVEYKGGVESAEGLGWGDLEFGGCEVGCAEVGGGSGGGVAVGEGTRGKASEIKARLRPKPKPSGKPPSRAANFEDAVRLVWADARPQGHRWEPPPDNHHPRGDRAEAEETETADRTAPAAEATGQAVREGEAARRRAAEAEEAAAAGTR